MGSEYRGESKDTRPRWRVARV